MMASLSETTSDEIYVDEYNIRERANTWPRSQLRLLTADAQAQHQNGAYYQISPTTVSRCSSSNLSLISESNESLNSCCFVGGNNGGGNAGALQQQQSQGTVILNNNGCLHSNSPGLLPSYKSGHPSYVELITQAIDSSPEKRMTLSEIYDWMAKNVVAFKDQRHLHSSTGWKNSVRHNLSLHSRFKRVKRNGMDKPSWWTVDMSEEIKRDRRHKHLKAGARIRTSPREQMISAGGAMVQAGNAHLAYGMSQHLASVAYADATKLISDQQQSMNAFASDPFVPQMVALNNLSAGGGVANGCGMFSKPGDVVGGCDYAFSQVSDSMQHQLPQTYATPINEYCCKRELACDKWNTSTDSYNNLPTSSLSTNNVPFVAFPSTKCKSSDSLSSTPNSTNPITNYNTSCNNNSAYVVINGDRSAYHQALLSSCSFSPSGNSLPSQQTFANPAKCPIMDTGTGTFDGFAQAITISLRDSTAPKASIALNVQALDDGSDKSAGLSKYFHNQQLGYGQNATGSSHYTLEQMRQILRIQAVNGIVQDVTVPSPIPLKVVINSEKGCQTDDLETDLQYRLHLNSPPREYDRSLLESVTPTASNGNVCHFMTGNQSLPVESYDGYSDVGNIATTCGVDTLSVSGDANLARSYNEFQFVQ